MTVKKRSGLSSEKRVSTCCSVEHSLAIFPDLVEVSAWSFECFALVVIQVKATDTGFFQIPVPFGHVVAIQWWA